MIDLLLTGLAVAASYYAAMFFDHLLGLDAHAEMMAEEIEAFITEVTPA